MKSILIERLANGWIVRPFCDGPGWPTDDRTQMYMYRNVGDLIKDLPELLEPGQQKESIEETIKKYQCSTSSSDS